MKLATQVSRAAAKLGPKRRRIESQSGQVLVLVTIALVAVLGCIALSGDVGFLQYQKNIMQTAADTAALAGAMELNFGDSVAAGKTDAATNGFTDGVNNVVVAINIPPTSGPNASNANYVEAIITQPEPTYFLRALNVTTVTVAARAVASLGNGPNCIYVMDPSVSSALNINGNVNIQSNCGILVDSSSSSGFAVNGNVMITAPTMGVVGGYTSNGNVTLTPTPRTGSIAATDPLAYVPAPTVGACSHTNFLLNGNFGSSGSPYQLFPGVYCGGLKVNGNSWLKFNPGTYILAGGGMLINGNSVMTGTGVTFYNTTGTGGYGAITLNGNTTSNFSAPTSGSLAGILFFQDRSIPSSAAASTINGNAGTTFDGAVYFPTTQVTFNGNSSINGYTIVVADKLLMNGNSTMGNNYTSLADGSPIKGPVLAE
ncbi:MAG TPA: pilus assembly protein TadG-related protein [Candidatus Binataceae bacterium]